MLTPDAAIQVYHKQAGHNVCMHSCMRSSSCCVQSFHKLAHTLHTPLKLCIKRILLHSGAVQLLVQQFGTPTTPQKVAVT